uniref:Tetraspanin n=1 Tax=Anopheles coluzzii TaxID=1518534 RepID=A0A8W7Q1Q8_ANOCL
MPPYRYPTHNFTYVSSCVKYMIFLLNFIFWLFGGLLIGIGFYAFVDKWQATGLIKLETFYDIVLNLSLVMIIAGAIVFVVSLAGCLGALRENTCLLNEATLDHYLRLRLFRWWSWSLLFRLLLLSYRLRLLCDSLRSLLWPYRSSREYGFLLCRS